MMESTATSAADLLLQNADFPDNFINMQHHDDYKIVSEPFVEYISHFVGHHNRLIVRACWKVGSDAYVPVSFVCDTGAPMGLYLSDKASNTLRSFDRIIEDEAGNEYADVHRAGKTAVQPTPPGHAPANIMGLRLLVKLSLELKEDKTFSLRSMGEYL